MKYSKRIQVLAAVVVLCSVAAWAADKGNTATVKLFDTVALNGTRLAPGEYKVSWEGSGPEVQVSFLQGKKVVATAQAKLVSKDVAYDNTAVVTKRDGNGLDLVAIQPQGKKQALELNASGSSMGQQ